jgi:hypothetical protein
MKIIILVNFTGFLNDAVVIMFYLRHVAFLRRHSFMLYTGTGTLDMIASIESQYLYSHEHATDEKEVGMDVFPISANSYDEERADAMFEILNSTPYSSVIETTGRYKESTYSPEEYSAVS